MKEFDNIEEMKEYYDKEKNLFYIEDDVKINFNLKCDWDIEAWDIEACDINASAISAGDIYAGDIYARDIKAWCITASDIYARDINAWNIYAENILYYAVCFAYKNIECKSIQGRREKCKHFVLDGELVVKGEEV